MEPEDCASAVARLAAMVPGSVLSAAGGGGDFPSGSPVSASSSSSYPALFGSGGGGGAAVVVPASPPPPPRPIPGLAALAGRGTVVVDAAPASEKVSSRPGGGGVPGL